MNASAPPPAAAPAGAPAAPLAPGAPAPAGSAPAPASSSLAVARRRSDRLGMIVFVALLALPPLIGDRLGTFGWHVLIQVLLFAAMAQAWNLIGGYGGQVSFGHSVFFGIGAYGAGMAVVKYGVCPWPGALLGAVVAALTAVVISYPCFRLQGHYFAIATFAIVEIFNRLFLVWGWVEGALGLDYPGLEDGWWWFAWAEGKTGYYYGALGLVAVVFGVVRWQQGHRFGAWLRAVREGQAVAESLGVDSTRIKLAAMAVSAFLTALCGAFFAQYNFRVDPSMVMSLELSMRFVLITILGGIGTLWGPFLGAAVLLPLQELTRSRWGGLGGGVDLIVFGLLIIVTVVCEPAGLVGLFRGWLRRSRSVSEPRPESEPPPAVEPRPASNLQVRSEPSSPAEPALAPASTSVPAPTSEGVAARGAATRDDDPLRVAAAPLPPPTTTRDAVVAPRAGIGASSGSDGMARLELHEVTVRFGALAANDQVSFTVSPGEIVGLIGPNGAGKTTLFNAISGVLAPAAGRITFAGHDITGWPAYRIARLGAVRTFQVVRPFPEMTVLENVMVGAYLKEADPGRAERIARGCLDRCRLGGLEDRLAGELPIGCKKRLEMARAIATCPRFLMLDESVAGLTSAEVRETVEVIRGLRDSGLTILIVEHIMEAVMSLADRLVVLDGGVKIAEGPPRQVVHDPTVVTAYFGEKFGRRLQEEHARG